jgi:ribonuclease HI
MMRMRLEFDGGGLSPKGSPNSWAAILLWEDGEVVEETSGRLEDSTINIAEYTALINGLLLAQKYAPLLHLDIQGDSELVIRQLTPKGEGGKFVYGCKAPELQPLQREAWSLLQRVGPYTLRHVKRNHNSRADALASKALAA